jgi:hypothetical protein
MTTLGKILVVLNLVFAVLFLGFAGATYNARLDLVKKTQDAEKRLADATKQKTIADTEWNESRAKAAKASTEVDDLKREVDKEKKAKLATIESLNKQIDDLKLQADQVGQKIVQTAQEATMRTKEVDQLKGIRNDLITKNTQLVSETSQLRDEIAGLKNEKETLIDRNRNLAEENRAVKAYVTRRGINLPSDPKDLHTGEADFPPPPDVEGIVRKVDGKYVEITLGENDGLKANHTLKIWRTGADAKYLGEVKVFTTQPKTAVVTAVSVSAPIKEGDVVGANLLANKR